MKGLCATLAMTFCLAVTVGAQPARPAVFLEPTEDGFHTYVAAALHKKKVPVTVVVTREQADFVLGSAAVEEEQVTTGRKWVNCLFAYCAGNEDKASTSVVLVDASGTVIWSYSVNKGRGAKNRQSMAEAIAKHLGNHLKRTR